MLSYLNIFANIAFVLGLCIFLFIIFTPIKLRKKYHLTIFITYFFEY